MSGTIIKEIKYGLRNHIFLLLLAGFFFFALMAPIMAKLLPQIVQSQFPHLPQEQINAMLNFSQAEIIRSFLGDVLEIVVIIVAFTLCGLLAQEIKEQTLVLPLCSGKSFAEIIGAKIIVFGVALYLISLLAVLINYLYAGMLFSFETGIGAVIRAGLLLGLFLNFVLVCLLMWGSMTQTPITAGIFSLITVYGQYGIAALFDLHAYFPSGLLVAANELTTDISVSLLLTIIITVVLCAVFCYITILRLKTREWNERI
ncbi:MAG: hypothetical protein GX197_05760 [Firmicutes bacterium]|nr:hypothetical protein [Bacillota bacterium]